MSVEKCILIIDDEQSLRYTLSVILKRSGYRVIMAASAKEALSYLRLGGIDLVFLDLKMPDFHGLRLLPHIRCIRPDLPVLILTGDDSCEMTVRALQMGARGYLLKPLNPKEILCCIEQVFLDMASRPKKLRPARIKSLSEAEIG